MTALYIILGVTVLALIVLLVVWLVLRKKKKRAAEGEDSGAGGDEVAQLIHEAEAKLAAAKLESAKVGNLPVFFLLGDPGSTKTSVMLHCGLDPELIAGQVYQNGNVVPTRTANFWFTRRTLFLEVGGDAAIDLAKWKKLISTAAAATLR